MNFWIKSAIQSIFLIVLVGHRNSSAIRVEFHGQSIGWMGISQNTSLRWGIRLIPRIHTNWTFHEKYQVATEASVNAFYVHEANERKIKPYRLWTTLSTSNWEIRLGLQQINFGSAFLLRSLMWFDRIDPRDPLRMTEGVYGLLYRYYVVNNVNLWTWILFGNEKPKGWELFGSDLNHPECGARIQMPLPRGEMALNFHKRKAKVKKAIEDPLISTGSHEEFRVALDGKWDIGPGIWFEECFVHRAIGKEIILKNQHFFTLGADYTFGIGHGLYVLTEHLESVSNEVPFGSGKTTKYVAFMADYPLSLTDRVSCIFFWDWEAQNGYRVFTWQRTTDQWSIYLMVFWNPKELSLPYPQALVWSGKGGQFLVVWHF